MLLLLTQHREAQADSRAGVSFQCVPRGTHFHCKWALLAPEVLPGSGNCPFDSAWSLQRKRNGTGYLEEAHGGSQPRN